MAVVPVPSSRVTFEDSGTGLRASWPARRRWYIVAFLLLWLGGWVVGEVTAAQRLATGAADQGVAFTAFWLAAWTLGGAFVLLTLGWQLAGRESLALAQGVLEHRRSVFGLGHRRAYDLGSVTNLRIDPRAATYDRWQSGMRMWGWGGGAIAFDYGTQTMRCGMGLDEPEAREVVARLAQQDRRLAAPATPAT